MQAIINGPMLDVGNSGIYCPPTSPITINADIKTWVTIDTETNGLGWGDDGWLSPDTNTNDDSWETAHRSVKKMTAAKLQAYRADANAWVVNTATGTTAGTINICCNSGSATTNAVTWTNYDTHYQQVIAYAMQSMAYQGFEPPRRRKTIAPPMLNHHGVVIRSIDKGRQFGDISTKEILALQLLRKMVATDDFRKYLRHSFVPVRGASGLVYQVHRNERITVWEKGEKIARLCVHLRGNVPPTDEVVGKILIIEYNEADIWKRSNITWQTTNRNRKSLEAIGYASTTEEPVDGNYIIHGADMGGLTIEGQGAIVTAAQAHRLLNQLMEAERAA